MLLDRKAITNLDSILENRDITLPTKVHIVKAIFFESHIQMWDLNEKAEHQRTDAFKLWCYRRLLSPSDSKESKPLNPKGNQP